MTHATSPTPPLLRLIALDADDLAVISAHLQDALIPVSDIAFLVRERRFVLAGRRFDWVRAAAGGCERCAVGLHFDYVQRVARSGFRQDETDRLLNLLAVHFEPREAPGGIVTLDFSGGAAIRLEVECLDAQMRDLGPRWPCTCEPKHPVEPPAA